MRVVFMGTPPPAATCLRALAGEREIAGVWTQPAKPKGRGLTVAPSPVRLVADEMGFPVFEPRTLRDVDEQARLAALEPDVICVVAYGKILPPEVLAIPRLGCVNVHFSLLPRWRGAAPVERAIMAGDAETGVTTMLMDEGLDTGPVLLVERTPIGPEETAGQLLARLSDMGAALLLRTLGGLGDGSIAPTPQPSDGASYADKLGPADRWLDPSRPGLELANRARALDPEPGAFVLFGGKRLKVWRARALPGDGEPGTVAAVGPEGPELQTSQGRLLLLEVQPEGKRRMSGAEYVRGYRPRVGERAEEPGPPAVTPG